MDEVSRMTDPRTTTRSIPLKYTLPLIAIVFAAGFIAGVRAVGEPGDSPAREAAIAFVRPDSVLAGMPDRTEEVCCGQGEVCAPSATEGRAMRERAVAALIGGERVGAKGFLSGHDTLSRPLADGRGVIIADVYWELGRLSEEVAYTQTTRWPWFTELSGVIYDTALDAARRDDGAITRDEWLGGFMVPVRVRGYGILWARFSWHTRSGRTGELFDSPTPALELFQPVDEREVKRLIDAYEVVVR